MSAIFRTPQCVAGCCRVLQGVAGCLPACHCHFCHFTTPRCVAVCGRVLQCVAGCCRVLQGVHPPVVAIFAILQLHCVIINCSVLQRVAACCSVLQVHPSVSVLQCVHLPDVAIFASCNSAMCCSLLQCVACCPPIC